MPIYQLDEGLWFPNPKYGEPDGLFAVGGDLSINRLLLAYSHGIFPWFAYQLYNEPHWYCPMDRFVIFPKEIHISHSMKQLMHQGKYLITMDKNFEDVIHGCSKVNSRNTDMGAWLGPQMINSYIQLHKMGIAHSVEVWEVGETENEIPKSRSLVGGLYGIELNGAFFGESMFSLVPSASKLALIHLAHHLEEKNYSFIDCQFETPHLLSMGGRHIPYDEYIAMLKAYAQKKE